MENKSGFLKLFSTILILGIALPILFKSFANLLLAHYLINVTNLGQLLPISEFEIFNSEFLFRLALAFSDFNFKVDTFINLINIYDLLPLLFSVLFLELNRITTKNRHIKRSLIFVFIVYLIKYLGLFAIVGITITSGYQFVLSFNYLGFWLVFVGLAFILTIIYLLWAYWQYSRFIDYQSWK